MTDIIPYKKTKTSKTICVFDCETDPFAYGSEIKPFTCGFYDGENYIDFWGDDCITQFGVYLNNRTFEGDDLLIYAHNFGGFDVHMMKEGFDWKTKPMIVNGRILRVYLWGQEFRDSYKIIPVPLKDLQKEEFDYSKNLRENREKYKREILSYQYSDCLNLYTPIMAFHEMFGDRLTIGNTAINMLQSYHGFERMDAMSDARIRPYFYGGRTQAFQKGIIEGAWNVYDVNSMYPYVMAEYHHPISNIILMSDEITADTAFLTVRGVNNGAFPTRHKDGSLDFTVEGGEFKVSIHEYNAAIELGLFELEEIIECFGFDEWSSFHKYIHTYYDLRLQAKEQGDKLNVLFYKLLMNNAYGKFAQDSSKFKDYLILGNGEMPVEGYHHEELNPKGWDPCWEHEYGVIWGRPSIKSPHFFNCATGASITGAARAELMRGIHGAKNVVYCDTDSIICEHASVDKDEKRLGAWKLEAEGNVIGIAGKKMYSLMDDGKVIKKASKGVGLTAQEIFAVAGGAEIVYEPMVPTFGLDGSVEYIKRRIKLT